MPAAIIDGIVTRYEVVGSGPPLLMYAPGGFHASSNFCAAFSYDASMTVALYAGTPPGPSSP
jgi:hypothetical protein